MKSCSIATLVLNSELSKEVIKSSKPRIDSGSVINISLNNAWIIRLIMSPEQIQVFLPLSSHLYFWGDWVKRRLVSERKWVEKERGEKGRREKYMMNTQMWGNRGTEKEEAGKGKGGAGKWKGREGDKDREIETQTQRTLRGPREPCVVVYSCIHSSWEVKARVGMSSRPAWAPLWVLGKPQSHSETLFHNPKSHQSDKGQSDPMQSGI